MSAISIMPELSGTDSEHFTLAAALFGCVARGTIVASAERRILACNEDAEKLASLKAVNLLGQPVSTLPEALQAVLDETLTTGNAVKAREVQLPCAQGNETVFLQVGTQIARQPNGRVLSVLLEMQNAGRASSIAANLEHLNRLANLGVVSAGVGHEIKNALVAIRTFVDLLTERFKDNELAQVVSREIARIDTAVRQVLLGTNREEFTMAPLNAHALLQDAVGSLRHEIRARSVQLALQLDAPLDRINGDERHLRHALLNLLINALEAMDQPGRLTVATKILERSNQRHLQVTISDTGKGIRPENLPHVFSPFFTTKKDGTGLGLAITRQTIQRHNGSIAVESKLNEGTTFRVFLPLL